jgi:hypothetical protein
MSFQVPTLHSSTSDLLSLLLRQGERAQFEKIFSQKTAQLLSFQIRYQQRLGSYLTPPQEQESMYVETAHRPSGALRKRFRALARQLHPDRQPLNKATPEDQRRNYKLLLEANQAYSRGDLRRLERIFLLLENVEHNPVELRASQIALIEEEIYDLAHQIGCLERSDLWKLSCSELELAEQGRDLLSELELIFEHRKAQEGSSNHE